ncbi:MAG: DUF1194 domain-containing protein [Kiloniellales bacterium]
MTRCAKRMLAAMALATAVAAGGPLGLAPAVPWVGSTASAEGHGSGEVDLELLLAVDTSSSVSAGEFDLQMRGLAAAFRHPAVLAAIEAIGDLGIAVALIQWSDARNQFVAIDWTAVRDEASALVLADEIDNSPRFLIGGGTAIGAALEFSLRQFERSPFASRRQVIDLSGDGRTNQGAEPAPIRDQAVARGITINGLAILNEDPYVGRYYSFNVIGGTGAFVMTAADYEDFEDAMLQKLIKEIAGVPVAAAPPPAPATDPRMDPATDPDASGAVQIGAAAAPLQEQ